MSPRQPSLDHAAAPRSASGLAIPDQSYLAYTREVPPAILAICLGSFSARHGNPAPQPSHDGAAWLLERTAHAGHRQPGNLVDEGVFYILGPGVRHHWRNAVGRPPPRSACWSIPSVPVAGRRLGRRAVLPETCPGCTAVHRFAVTGDDELRHLFWMAGDHLTADHEARDNRFGRGAVGIGWPMRAPLTSDPKQAAMPDELAQEIRRLLLSRVSDRLSISDVARQLGVSPTRAKEAFRKAFGCGIVAYQNELKIWQAKRLLCDLSLTVDEVSARLGFSSHSYFSQVFLQHTGETPTEFRRRDVVSP